MKPDVPHSPYNLYLVHERRNRTDTSAGGADVIRPLATGFASEDLETSDHDDERKTVYVRMLITNVFST